MLHTRIHVPGALNKQVIRGDPHSGHVFISSISLSFWISHTTSCACMGNSKRGGAGPSGLVNGFRSRAWKGDQLTGSCVTWALQQVVCHWGFMVEGNRGCTAIYYYSMRKLYILRRNKYAERNPIQPVTSAKIRQSTLMYLLW